MPAPDGDVPNLSVGDNVTIGANQAPGIVMFIGSTEFAEGEWIGVKLESPGGKNNGSVQGKSYFECPDNHGIFVRRHQVVVTAKAGPKPKARASASAPGAKAKAVSRPSKSANNPEDAAMFATDAAASEERKEVKSVGNERSTGSSRSSVSNDPAATAKAQRDLAEAVEEQDIDEIRRLIPVAISAGVSVANLENAHRVLNFKLEQELLMEIEEVRSSVMSLSEEVEQVRAKARAAGLVMDETDLKESFGRQIKEDSQGINSLADLSRHLEGRLWPLLQRRIDEAVNKALSAAAGELSLSVNDLRRQLRSGGVAAAADSDERTAASLEVDDSAADEEQRRAQAALRIQSMGRGKAARKQVSEKRHQKTLSAAEANAQRKERMDIYEECRGQSSSLNASTLEKALQKVKPDVSTAQVNAMFKGYLANTRESEIGFEAFVQILEAVLEGPEVAAEFAGMSLAAYSMLGVEGGDAAAIKLQKVSRGQQARKELKGRTAQKESTAGDQPECVAAEADEAAADDNAVKADGCTTEDEQRKAQAAVKIQSSARGKAARKEVSEKIQARGSGKGNSAGEEPVAEEESKLKAKAKDGIQDAIDKGDIVPLDTPAPVSVSLETELILKERTRQGLLQSLADSVLENLISNLIVKGQLPST